MSTKVVNMNTDVCDVLIDRSTKWGNPYSHKAGTLAKFRVKSRKEAIEKYRKYILDTPELLNCLDELEGRILGCHCRPKPCHGDVLVELINQKHNLQSILE